MLTGLRALFQVVIAKIETRRTIIAIQRRLFKTSDGLSKILLAAFAIHIAPSKVRQGWCIALISRPLEVVKRQSIVGADMLHTDGLAHLALLLKGVLEGASADLVFVEEHTQSVLGLWVFKLVSGFGVEHLGLL